VTSGKGADGDRGVAQKLDTGLIQHRDQRAGIFIETLAQPSG
jgi:hypothetical protein